MISVPYEPHIINVSPKSTDRNSSDGWRLPACYNLTWRYAHKPFHVQTKVFLSSTPQSRDVLPVGPLQDLVMFVTFHQSVVFIIIWANHVASSFVSRVWSSWFSWIFEGSTSNSIIRGPTILHNFQIMSMNRSVLTDNQLKHPLASRWISSPWPAQGGWVTSCGS